MAAKRTVANIQRTRVFSVNLANVEMAPFADYVGSISGENGPKDAMPYGFEWGEKAHVPVLDASHCVFECKLSHTHVIGDFYTFFGEVVNLHIDESLTPNMESHEALFKWFKSIDIHKMDPLVYHSVLRYFHVGKKVEAIKQT